MVGPDLSDDLHRRRILACLDHQQADRIPLTIGGPSCSLHRDAHQGLLRFLGFSPERDAPVIDRILQIVEPDPQILRRFDVDLLWLLPHEPDVDWSADRQSYVDELGREFVAGGGFFNQVGHPLRDGGMRELQAYQLPAISPERASGPATIVGPGTVIVSLAPDGPARPATDDVVRHCREWGARIIEVAPSRAVADSHLLAVPADVDERYAPLTVVPPVALLAYVLAGLRGATPDRPSWTERYHSQGLTHIVGV